MLQLKNYKEALANPTERGVKKLANIADVVIWTDRRTADDVLLRAVSHAGLFSKNFERVVNVIVGGQFGSKGTRRLRRQSGPVRESSARGRKAGSQNSQNLARKRA